MAGDIISIIQSGAPLHPLLSGLFLSQITEISGSRYFESSARRKTENGAEKTSQLSVRQSVLHVPRLLNYIYHQYYKAAFSPFYV